MTTNQEATAWHADADGVIYTGNDFTMGDDQAWAEHSVRLVRDDVPTAFIEVNVAALVNRVGRYAPVARIEYLIGTDPGDLTGTEVWSDIEYEDDHVFDYEGPEQADREAAKIAEYYAGRGAEEFMWDGVTSKIRNSL